MPCEGDDGLAQAAALGKARRSGLQPRPLLHSGQHDLGGFIEQARVIPSHKGRPAQQVEKYLTAEVAGLAPEAEAQMKQRPGVLGL
jgi:predicted NodU family carbamoyl transferase